MRFNQDRALRYRGQKPTARERWGAFYRIYRLARKCSLDPQAILCLDVLGLGKMVQIVECRADWLKNNNIIPLEARKLGLQARKRRRIYGEHMEKWDFWYPKDQEIARRLSSEQGVEMTPEEVGDVRVQGFSSLRRMARERCIVLPEDDMDLHEVLKKGWPRQS